MTSLLAIRAFLKRVPAWAWAALAIIAALYLSYRALDAYGKRRYDEGRIDERAAWVAAAAKAKALQVERERVAGINLQRQRARDDAAAIGRKQEIDNATRHIPDQALTNRQRARACLSLRAEAKAAGRAIPAC